MYIHTVHIQIYRANVLRKSQSRGVHKYVQCAFVDQRNLSAAEAFSQYQLKDASAPERLIDIVGQ